jgi:hypothetical protein
MQNGSLFVTAVLVWALASALSNADEKPAEVEKRPAGYPAEITVKEAESVLKRLKNKAQGCGVGTWDGEEWGFYQNYYGEECKTPWLDKVAKVSADFVYDGETTQEHFLIEIELNDNIYQRDKRSQTKLVWRPRPRE